MGFDVAVVELGIGRLDRELTAVRHRVPGIHREIQDHLVELGRVDAHLADTGRGTDAEVDPFAEQAPKHRGDRKDRRARVENARREDLSAREGEQLTRELGGPIRRGDDLVEVRSIVDQIGRQMVAHELGVAADGRQHVVEVMGNATGQLADGLHLRDLALAGLMAALLGDLVRDRENAVHPTGRVPQHVLGREPGSGQAIDGLFLVIFDGLARFDDAAIASRDRRRALRAKQIRVRQPDHLGGRAPETFGVGLVDEHVAPVEILHVDVVGGAVEELLQESQPGDIDRDRSRRWRHRIETAGIRRRDSRQRAPRRFDADAAGMSVVRPDRHAECPRRPGAIRHDRALAPPASASGLRGGSARRSGGASIWPPEAYADCRACGPDVSVG